MTSLKEGDKAPFFKGPDQSGREITFDDFRGKKLILYFYPKDDTSGCTAEACSLNGNYAELSALGYEIVGISPDPVPSHLKFAAKYSLSFHLIADPEKKILQDYGVWGEKSMYGRKYMGVLRTTFILDETGIIQNVILKVDTKNAAAQILKIIEHT